MPTKTALQEAKKADISSDDLTAFFNSGMHYGLKRSKRHPSTINYIFGHKDGIEIIDLEKTQDLINRAERFAEQIGEEGGTILWVTSKNEANSTVKEMAESVEQPYVTGRWIGGTLTNFDNIRSRIDKLEELEADESSGELEKFTKKEQVLFAREMRRLRGKFGGIRSMTKKPDAMFVVDSKAEEIAIAEAHQNDIPVMSISNTDCDIEAVNYPIVANDTSKESIKILTKRIRDAYARGADISL